MTNKEYIATLSSTDLATLLGTYIADLKHGNTVITTRQKFIEFLEAESEAKSNSAAKIDNVNRIANGAYKAGSRGRLKAYVCSPYRGDTKRNIKYAQKITKWAIRKGYAPIVPHLYIPQVLDDTEPADRAVGLDIGLALLQGCELVIVGGQYGISAGMANEIREALRLCIPIKHI